jgi:protein-disulfide isomerase
VYRHWPLGYHAFAASAARASECAATQGKFWEYHDLLYAEQRNIPTLAMLDLAIQVDVPDTSAFASCTKDEALLKRVVDEGELARTSGGRGTPTWIVNGKLIHRIPDSALVAQLISERGAKK